MSTEKEFDELLRSKFDEQEFPFDEANWDDAEDMIDRERKKEKRRRWFFIYFIGMLSGVCVMLPFLLNTNESNLNDTNAAHADSEKNSTHKTFTKNNTNQIDTIESAILADNIETEININQNTINTNHAYNQSGNEKSDTYKNSDGQKNNSIAQSDKSPNQNGQSDSNQNQGNYTNNSGLDKLNSDLSINNNSETHKTTNTTNNENTNDKEKIDSANSIQTNDENQTDIASNEKTNDTDSSEKIIDPVDTTALKDVKIDSNNREKDSAYAENQEEKKDDVFIEPFVPVNALSLFGGLAFSLGTNYNDTISGRGFSPSLGMIYEHHWKKKLAFSAGMLYHFSGAMNYNSQESISHHPSFGLNDSVVSYSMKRFHFFNVPIQFIFYLNQKNSIGFGGNFSFTGFSISTIENQIRSNSGTTILSERKGLNYLNGFTRYDAMLTLSYRRKLGERWMWYTDFNFGLIDYANNSVFASNKFERNIFAQTGITFNILKP